MNHPALNILNLSKSYGDDTVVDDISFSIKPGEIFGLLGPNGAGKSTIINMISGVTNIDAGSISVFGFDNRAQYRTTRSLIGVMHQEIVMELSFNVQKALELHAGYYGVKDNPEWRETLLDRLDLGLHRYKKFRQLSGGMKRRFMIAKALIHRPKLLILDEPTAGVDVELRHALWNFVREMNEDGLSILLTTHYLEEAESMCDRIAIMNHGRIIALEPTEELIRKIGERKLSLQLTSSPSSIPDDLKEFELCRSRNPNEIVFRLRSGTDIAVILDRARAHGWKIADVDTIQPDLEDVFLKLTGNGKRL